jgi:hypothetical protein
MHVVVIGSDGMVSLAALRWLADQDPSFSMLQLALLPIGVPGNSVFTIVLTPRGGTGRPSLRLLSFA